MTQPSVTPGCPLANATYIVGTDWFDEVLDYLRPYLDRHEQIQFTFVADAGLTWRTVVPRAMVRGGLNAGNVYVVLTDRSVLVVEKALPFYRERNIARLPRPSTFGPVTGAGWILLDGQPLLVVGGPATVADAEAVLSSSPASDV